MEKDQPETQKLKRCKRPIGTSTPEPVKKNVLQGLMNSRMGSSRQRATMLPSDFSLPQAPAFNKRKMSMARCSMLPTQVSLDNTRMSEAESNDVEVEILYDEYLRKTMTEIILKKRAEETEKLCISQIATIAKEYDRNEEICHKLKTRERDILNLAKLQNNIDSQVEDLNNCIKSEDTKTIATLMSQLHTLLKPLDIIRCKNIILPDTPEEWNECSKSLRECSETLKCITDIIGCKGESYEKVSNDLKEYMNTLNGIQGHQKRLEKDINSLQAVILKVASLSLAQRDNFSISNSV